MASFAHLMHEAMEQRRQFQFDHGYYDFTVAESKAKADFVRLTSSYIIMGLNVVRELEEAVLDCKGKCFHPGRCEEDPIESLDDAVASYVGHFPQEAETAILSMDCPTRSVASSATARKVSPR